MSSDVLTIGFARRATPYKRADLLFRDIERLSRIAGGKLQIIYAGKAHPKDGAGKDNIHKIIEAARALSGSQIPVVFPGKLRHGTRAQNHRGRRCVAQHSDAPA
jgi:starch phosphorylase